MFSTELFGVKINPAKSARNLGVRFDKNFTFHSHISVMPKLWPAQERGSTSIDARWPMRLAPFLWAKKWVSAAVVDKHSTLPDPMNNGRRHRGNRDAISDFHLSRPWVIHRPVLSDSQAVSASLTGTKNSLHEADGTAPTTFQSSYRVDGLLQKSPRALQGLETHLAPEVQQTPATVGVQPTITTNKTPEVQVSVQKTTQRGSCHQTTPKRSEPVRYWSNYFIGWFFRAF